MNPDKLRRNCAVLYYKSHTGDLVTINLRVSDLTLSNSVDGDIEINIKGCCSQDIFDNQYPDITHLAEAINKAANAMASSSRAFEESIVRMPKHLNPQDITWEDLLKGVN